MAFVLSMFQVFISITMFFEGEMAPEFLGWVNFVLSSGVLFLLGSIFLPNLVRELFSLRVSLASLIFTGTMAAYGLSVWSLFTATGETYFETASMILTFYIGSLLLDAHFKRKLAGYGKTFEDRTIPEAPVKNNEGLTELQPANLISAGSTAVSIPGEYLWFDGIVKTGSGLVDESHLTGEPNPILKTVGDTIRAGSKSIDGGLEFITSSLFDQSTFQRYLEKARNSRYQPGFYERMAHRGASILLFFVLLTASSVLLYYANTAGWDIALRNALSVLLIGCPCAFSISTPAAIWIANQRLQDSGLLVVGGGQTIEGLTSVNLVIFDKTGTLTSGIAVSHPETHGSLSVNEAMQLAGGLEAQQAHPIATAVRNWLTARNLTSRPVSEPSVLPGEGLRGFSGEDEVLLVNHKHPIANTLLPKDRFGLFVNNKLQITFALYQPPKEHLSDSLDMLQKLGVSYCIISGDPAPAPEWMDADNYFGNVSPEQKFEKVKAYQQNGNKILFAGDGTNDMMASAAADIGVILGDGPAKAKETADIILLHPNLMVIPHVLKFSKRVKKVIQTNFFWALVYNIVGMSIAAMGLLHPFFAILAMILSSLFVTMNSLRMRTATPELAELAQQVNKED
ncbi:MAG: HAD-IC family P-type ATPase [Balneolia bacterium]|nr:HAD-IC family P-type ATPase [Balneolia bacterium]